MNERPESQADMNQRTSPRTLVEPAETSVPDYGSPSDSDANSRGSGESSERAPTTEQEPQDNRDSNDRSAHRSTNHDSQPSRKDQIDRETDNIVKAGVGTATVLGLGAAILGD